MPSATETHRRGRHPTAEPRHPARLILGRYRLLGHLATGGSARVVRARDDRLGRDVAVKLLHPHLLAHPGWRERIEAEARTVAELAHPGIAVVYDVDVESDAPALVMELVDGDPLASRLRSGPLPAEQVARIGAQLADALYLAHRRGVIHRDVKPSNIILERGTGRARLVDFGIAQRLAAAGASTTDAMAATTIGTPRYMSPEQLRGGPITPRADLWSLGVVLHEALAGTLPFPGPSPEELLEQQRMGPPNLNIGHASLEAVIRRCMAFDVADRPLHAGALAAELGDWLARASSEAAASAPPLVAPRRSGLRRRLVRAAAAAAVVGMFLLGFLVAPRAADQASEVPQPALGSQAPTATPETSPAPTGVQQGGDQPAGGPGNGNSGGNGNGRGRGNGNGSGGD